MLRRIAQLFVLMLIAALGLRAWGPSAGARQIRVMGPSMAPTLLGEHDAWMCADCRFPFATGADSAEVGGQPAVCPNCGRPQPEEVQPRHEPGDRYRIELREARGGRPMLRWETIVFRCPESVEQNHAKPHCIKRVVGLPGETVELRGGDVWINGVLARKTLTQQQAMAMVVHDSRFVPRAMDGTLSRWKGAESDSGWVMLGDGSFTYSRTSPREFHASPVQRLGSSPGHPDSPTDRPSKLDWLEYTHWRRSPEDPARFEPAAIMDDYAYNRDESRRLKRVNDLLLWASIKAVGPSMLAFRGSVDGHTYVVQLEPRHGRGRLLCDGVLVEGASFDVKKPLLASSSHVDFSLIDHQVQLAIDGLLLVNHPCPIENISKKKVAAENAPPFAIGASELSVTIDSLTLLRDIYYIAPVQPKAVTLGRDEYYVLGDNSPLSADSRSGWPGPGLDRKYLIGVLQAP